MTSFIETLRSSLFFTSIGGFDDEDGGGSSSKYDENDETSRELFIKKQQEMKRNREEALKRLYAGVEVKNRRYKLKKYKRCFIASEAVDFMVQSGWATSRDDAVELGRELQDKFNLFEHVVEPHKHRFKDDYLFFKFNASQTGSDGGSSSDTNSLGNPNSNHEKTSRISRFSVRTGSASTIHEEDADDSEYIDNNPYRCTSLVGSKKLGLRSVAELLRRGVKMQYNMKYDCEGFWANDAVDYLVSTGLATSRSDAVNIARGIQNELSYIQNSDLLTFKDTRLFFTFTEERVDEYDSMSQWREDIEEARRFFESNMKVRDHTYRMRVYKETFTGSEAVDLFQYGGITSSRQDAVLLGRALSAEYNLFHHVVKEHEFEDTDLFFVFSKERRVPSYVPK